VRLTRVQERLFPARIREVDVDGPITGAADAFERRFEVVDLVREVMGAGTVAGDEALEEIALVRRPGLEQLEVHALVDVAQPHGHGAEAGALAAEENDAAELADQHGERVRDIARRQSHVIQIHFGASAYEVSGTGGP